MVQEFVKNNIWGLLFLIFAAGGVTAKITMQGVKIDDLEKRIIEIEENKVSVSTNKLNLDHISSDIIVVTKDVKTLSDRVRRKLDGQLKENTKEVIDLRLEVERLKCK